MSNKQNTVEDDMLAAIELIKKKNIDYGNSKDKFGQIAMILFKDGIKLNSKYSFNEFAIIVHIIDKVMRLTNLWGKDGAIINFESIGDTCVDLGNYSFMLKNMIENNMITSDNIEEFR